MLAGGPCGLRAAPGTWGWKCPASLLCHGLEGLPGSLRLSPHWALPAPSSAGSEMQGCQHPHPLAQAKGVDLCRHRLQLLRSQALVPSLLGKSSPLGTPRASILTFKCYNPALLSMLRPTEAPANWVPALGICVLGNGGTGGGENGWHHEPRFPHL